MMILKTVIVCILGIVVAAVSGLVAIPSMFVIAPFKENHKVAAIIMAAFDIISKFVAVLAIAWISNKFGVKFTLLILILPVISTLVNDFNRVRAAGGTVIFTPSGSGLVSERDRDKAMFEYAHLVGDILGFVVGTLYIL